MGGTDYSSYRNGGGGGGIGGGNSGGNGKSVIQNRQKQNGGLYFQIDGFNKSTYGGGGGGGGSYEFGEGGSGVGGRGTDNSPGQFYSIPAIANRGSGGGVVVAMVAQDQAVL